MEDTLGSLHGKSLQCLRCPGWSAVRLCPSAGPLALPEAAGRGSPRVRQWELTQGSSWLQAGHQLQRQRQQLQRFQLPLEILVSVPVSVLLGLAFPVPVRVQKIQVRASFFLWESGSASRALLPGAPWGFGGSLFW